MILDSIRQLTLARRQAIARKAGAARLAEEENHMDEQTREAALRFWNARVMDHGDIVLGAVEALENFHLEGEGGFEALGLALREEATRRVRQRGAE